VADLVWGLEDTKEVWDSAQADLTKAL